MRNEYGTLGIARKFLAGSGSKRPLIFPKEPQRLRQLGAPELFAFARTSAGNAPDTRSVQLRTNLIDSCRPNSARVRTTCVNYCSTWIRARYSRTMASTCDRIRSPRSCKWGVTRCAAGIFDPHVTIRTWSPSSCALLGSGLLALFIRTTSTSACTYA